MRHIFYISFFLYISLFPNCEVDNAPKQKSIVENRDTADTRAVVPVFWKTICKNNRFTHLFNCNALECYQIELLNDPFKDLVIISIYFQDSTYNIYYNRFIFKTSKLAKTKHFFETPIVNPITNDTLFCYHRSEKNIISKKNIDTDIFFRKLIWKMSRRDKTSDRLDEETWTIKGRLNGREIYLSRYLFQDSIYYSNIQKILDICKVKDYAYEKK